MVDLIERYDEFNAATLNSRFAQLEAQYNLIRNPFETIAAGTLAAPTAEINIRVVGASWSLIKLQLAMPFTGVGGCQPVLTVNNSNGDVGYKNANFSVGGSGAVQTTSALGSSSASILFDTANGLPLIVDAWITPYSGGFAMLGSATGTSSAGGGGIMARRFGSMYAPYAIESLQMRFFIGCEGTYDVGGTYRLEGMRA